jgi:hypothetical protein
MAGLRRYPAVDARRRVAQRQQKTEGEEPILPKRMSEAMRKLVCPPKVFRLVAQASCYSTANAVTIR